MPGANDSLVDQFIIRAVNLEKFKAGERKRALKLLKSLEDDIVVDLSHFTGSAWSKARLQALLTQVRSTILTAYDKMNKSVTQDLTKFADAETQWTGAALNSAIGANLISVEFGAAQLKAVVGDALIEGGPQVEWWQRQAAATQNGFADAVRKGIVSGDTTDKIVSTLRNTLFQGTLRRNVEALVRTGIASVSNEARNAVYEQNADVIGWVQQHSTLDGRTTQICMAYSGKRWSLPDYEPIGHNLPFRGGVPRHWGCRSQILPGLPAFDQMGDPFGKKNPQRAMTVFRSSLRENGMSEAAIDRAVPAAQASMDGYVPEDLTYEQWLKRKPEAFQKQMLGETKWKLWKAGKINFSDLVNEDGDAITLDELRKRAS